LRTGKQENGTCGTSLDKVFECDRCVTSDKRNGCAS
jgi:hypothetical protein